MYQYVVILEAHEVDEKTGAVPHHRFVHYNLLSKIHKKDLST